MKNLSTNWLPFSKSALRYLVLLFVLMSIPGRAQVVISEVYAAGGESGAALRNDFIELYNPSAAAVSLNNYSLQYNPQNGGGNYDVAVLGNLSIPANGYFLVQFASSGANGAVLSVTPNATSTINLGSTGGRIALVNTTAALSNSAAANAPGILDFVGYGGTDRFEGAGVSPLPTLTASIERKAGPVSTSASMAVGGTDALQGNGYDSNNNNFDFILRLVPLPQNSASPAEVYTLNTIFYSKAAGALHLLANFSSTPDGTGPPPASFTADNQIFNITGTNRTIAGNLTVAGTNSKVVLGANASFIVPVTANFTGTLDLGNGATLVQQNAAPAVMFGTVNINSTVEFSQAGDYTVPILGTPGYGNLTLRNATKRLSVGTTVVRANLLVGDGGGGVTVLAGASALASVLNLRGNLTLVGTVEFSPAADEYIRLTANGPGSAAAQVFNGGGNTIRLFSLTGSAAGVSLASSTSNLELGTSLGGGYVLAPGRTLSVNANTLSFAPGSDATIAGAGTLTVSAASNLVFNKAGTDNVGTLRLTSGSTLLNNFTLNTVAMLTLGTGMTVQGALNLTNGTLSVGANTLALTGTVTPANGVLQGGNAATSNLTIGGSGTISALRFAASAAGRTFGTVILNRPGTTSLASSLTVANSLLLTAGTLSLSGHTLALNGTVTSAAGLLNGSTTSNLTVGPGSTAVGTVSFAGGGRTLNALSLDRLGQTLTIGSGTLEVRLLTLTSGVLELGDGVTLNVTGPLIVADPEVARFAGTIDGSGLPTSSLFILGTGSIGTLSFVPGLAMLQQFSLDRGGNQTALLLNTLTVNILSLSRGFIFALGNERVEVLAGGTVIGGGNNSYVNALTRAVITNLTNPTVSQEFPLGVGGQYRPLVFRVTDQVIGTTSYTARQFEGPSPVRTLPATLARVSQLRYYNLVRERPGSSTLQSAAITLAYAPASDLVNSGNNSLLRIAKTDPADGSRWLDIGGFGTGSTITSTVPFGPELGDFTISTDISTPLNVNPLPVELVRFGAVRQAGGVQLSWATASEKNSDFFDVQRSLDGQVFATVANVAAQGTTSQAHAYAVLDAPAPARLLYYRLRQVDIDGTVAYSPVVTVAAVRDAAAEELTVYPNPATDQLTASLSAAAGRTYRVVNALGQVLAQGPADASNPSVDVRRLPVGTYFLELHTAGGRQVRRFVKTN